jgi:ABC-type transport system involved in multi-copper enzyme maturation permease subunit
MYVLFSWWCWWYGGSFGMRALIESYVFLSIPMACFFTWVSGKRSLAYMVSVFTILCIALNIYQSFQYKYSVMSYDSMTARAYARIWGKMEIPKDIDKYLDHPDYNKALNGHEE